MGLRNLKNIASSISTNLGGKRIERKIVVIESDDWGSIRMPNRYIYDKLIKDGIRVDLNPYEKYDSILTLQDLKETFSLLESFRDIRGNHPIITANTVVSNPDFKLIKECNYENYQRESVVKTLSQYENGLFENWNYGAKKGLLQFQYHAREHVNVSLWMKSLQLDEDLSRLFFNQNMVGGLLYDGRWYNPFVEATRFSNEDDKVLKIQNYVTGLKEFENIFGYLSKTVIPTNYLWDSTYDFLLQNNGVNGLQGSKFLINPLNTSDIKRRFSSKRYGEDFVDIVRNCHFEPSILKNKKKTLDALKQEIKISFHLKKPAVISMHRINLSGRIFQQNRDENLILLYDFFSWLLKTWPEVEFKSSDELIKLYL